MSRERLLQPGVNFTTRGELKLARAVHLANELRGRIDEWSAAETLIARPHQVDERTVELRLILRREPPIEEWGLILGDCLHNLRSMLDNVAWALATLDGAVPAQPTQVTFPVTDTETEWRKRIASLESIPPDLLDRVRHTQPWVSGVSRADSRLGILHSLDITDKHRQLISSSVRFKRILMGALDFGDAPLLAGEEASLTYEMRNTPAELEDDAVIMTIRSSARPLALASGYRARLDAQFAVARDETSLLMLDSFVNDLLSSARDWLNVIYGGVFHAQQMAAASERTEAIAVYGYLDEDGVPRITQAVMRPPKDAVR